MSLEIFSIGFTLPLFDDDDRRPIEVFEILDIFYPQASLDVIVDGNNQIQHVPDRVTWLQNRGSPRMEETEGMFMCNSQVEWFTGLQISASYFPNFSRQDPRDVALVGVDLPLVELEQDLTRIKTLMLRLGDALDAWRGGGTPPDGHIRGLFTSPDDENIHNPPPPPGFPRLLLGTSHLSGPEHPQRLSWLNYWSAPTAVLLSFPDPTRDEALLARSISGRNGSWVVPLTEEPLDITRPDHIEIMREAYARFDMVGTRQG